ncbi:uncharacterized protein LOC127282500 isoform X2 [Leptopilina boulardi]|nr:uncharacterized protein LOC127282500 isoform X2 [Leptopilina boulardi]
MGLTQCGQFLLTYTYNVELSGTNTIYKYLLHWWAFMPNRVARKVAEVTLFGNFTIYRELSIVIAQWPMERNKLVVHGLCSHWLNLQRVDRAYLTITTVPSLDNCKECLKVAASYEEEGEDLAANWDSCVRCNCLQHGLTVHTTYEILSPFPRFRAVVCLNYSNHVVVNTGNFLHILRVDMDSSKVKQKNIDKQESRISDIVQLDVSDVEESDDLRAERYDSSYEKGNTPESTVDQSPKCESIVEYDFCVDVNKLDDSRDLSTNTSNDLICDTKYINNISVRLSECIDNANECECDKDSISRIEQASSVRDKILQDFCEDMSQELNIGSDLITLVKHPSCSPRSTPQRLPSNFKQSWISQIFNPPSDILRTRNSESSHKNLRCQRPKSPQPGVSHDASIVCITSINSPLHTLSINPSPSCSPRLMSPPVTKSFRHLSPRKKTNLQPSSTPPRTRASHKLILEAEKAYEFTDEAQETCEKLSSFRKRRLADKKYEFCDEAEDAENIVPFKHIRGQTKNTDCSIGSPHSETDELNTTQDITIFTDVQMMDSVEKNVLRPLNQNQLSNGTRDRSNKNLSSSSMVPKGVINPVIKCTTRFKRSYIELDDEMISVITDVEDDETGGYVSYQCVLPMNVHGSGYAQMQMISNSKAEKNLIPCVSINQLSFDIETFSHHIADWICKIFKKKYWYCSDYDIEIINVCALTGDILSLLIMKIQASENSNQGQSSQERKQYEACCKFTWNIDTGLYKVTHVLPMVEVMPDWVKPNSVKSPTGRNPIWNPTRRFAPKLRENNQQPYARTVRFLHNEMTLAGESISRLQDLDNLVEFYITPIPVFTSSIL